MNFDEQIEKLRKLHQAIIQSMELHRHENRDQRHNIVPQEENTDKPAIEAAVQQQTLDSVLVAMKELTELVATNKRRLSDLEEKS